MNHKEIDPDDLPEDLKGDIVPEIDQKKLFDEKEYATIIIGDDVTSKKDSDNAALLATLVSNKSSREEKDGALIGLKENNAQDFIVKAIERTKKPDQKAILIAACWETGLDFSKHFMFFINLVCDQNFAVSFEAFTVIQEIENEIDQSLLKEALNILNNSKKGYSTSVNDAIELVTNKLNNA